MAFAYTIPKTRPLARTSPFGIRLHGDDKITPYIKQAHFDAALKIDSRSPRNHYCRGLVALELGDVPQAKASFQRALRCKPTSPEEEDVGDFFHAESQGALAALQRREREGGRWKGAGVPIAFTESNKLAADW